MRTAAPCSKKKAGISLVELLLVISIVAILSATLSPFLSSFITRNNHQVTLDTVLSSLRKAQLYSMNQRDNATWGACLINNTFRMYQGSCNSPITADDYDIPVNITIAGLSDLSFSAGQGIPTSSVTISIASPLEIAAIVVNEAGGISTNFETQPVPTNTPSPTPTSSPTPTPTPTPSPTPSPTPTATPSPTPSPTPTPTPTPSPTPLPTPSPIPPNSDLVITGNITSNWTQGYCYEFTVTNNGPGSIDGWTVYFLLADATITSTWEGVFGTDSGWQKITPNSGDTFLFAGDSISPGFCANKTGSNYLPTNSLVYADAFVDPAVLLTAQFVTTADWNTGYCMNIQITNTGSSTAYSWQATFRKRQYTITSSWGATYSLQGNTFTAVPFDWAEPIGAGQTSNDLGFCASKDNPNNHYPSNLEIESQ